MQDEVICKGSMLLGTGCGKCKKCREEVYQYNLDTIREQEKFVPQMDVDTIKQKKIELEHAITELLSNFEKDTKCRVTNVNSELTATMSGEISYTNTKVTVEI